MTILNFAEQFPDEKSCRDHMRGAREKEVVVCKNCMGTEHYWLKAKWAWQCAGCDFRTSLRSGTVMENSNLPVRKWYLAMAFMTFTKKGMSAKELQKQIGHKRYNTVWSLMHRIRAAMGKRDDLYGLEGMIEFDEGHFEKATDEGERRQLKRGRGSQRQSNVAVMAESTRLEDIETGKTDSHVRYFKMKVLETHEKDGVNQLVSSILDGKSIVFSDKSTSYVDIEDYVEMHLTEKSGKETTRTTLKWVHIAIGNAKRNFLGIYHKIDGKYLQNYLNEFCYKLNRRYFGDRLFDRLVVAVTHQYWCNSV
jgi:hypothetical protein